MDEKASGPGAGPKGDWEKRQQYWRKKLGRLRLGVEPVEVQVAKYRRVTWVLTAISAALAAAIVALFAAFRRPDVGIVLASILFAPIVGLAWLDFALLASRASRYLRERRDHESWGSTWYGA